jgi:hypothetical protein
VSQSFCRTREALIRLSHANRAARCRHPERIAGEVR